MLASLFAGTLIPIILIGVTVAVSGFSYRTGKTCTLNHRNSFAVFWGWLIGFAVLAFLLQASTSVYCITIYFRQNRSQYNRESTAVALRKRWADIRTVIAHQCRSVALSVLVLVIAVFVVAVYWVEDLRFVNAVTHPGAKEFSECLVRFGGDKDKCLEDAEYLMISKDAVLASMILAAVSLHRPSIREAPS